MVILWSSNDLSNDVGQRMMSTRMISLSNDGSVISKEKYKVEERANN